MNTKWEVKVINMLPELRLFIYGIVVICTILNDY